MRRARSAPTSGSPPTAASTSGSIASTTSSRGTRWPCRWRARAVRASGSAGRGRGCARPGTTAPPRRWRTCAGRWEIPDAALQRMRHLYTRSVAYADDWLCRLMELLDARGVLDETLLIATSDHGENLGESRLFGHGFSLDERLI